jgi:hypothetical protein
MSLFKTFENTRVLLLIDRYLIEKNELNVDTKFKARCVDIDELKIVTNVD